ncbi:hypothetical protein B0A55_02058 [Friedmanniomyces simplex]|uniref:Uncharacterized protein n=1 Tax=Friedmanniomyces simplex TaxID=329884 RepID=A0A4V5NI20_9PEZI|nr:hypothetical protein B0A55_02058 [Friedmanniomyces simplex]
MSYVVTGASRGIGLELIKQLLDLPASQVTKVFALTRSTPPAALQTLLDKHADRAEHITASVNDTQSVQQAAQAVEAKLEGKGLDVLINNAGIFGAVSTNGATSIPPEELARVLDVNVVGPHRMMSAFLPLLEAGKQKKVINITSTLGSLALSEHYTFAPVPPYKVSKTALNMLNKQYALEYKGRGFTFLAVSPGWLKTDLGGPHADLDVDVGVAEVIRITLEATPEQNGQALNIRVPGMEERYDGKVVPW